MSFLRVLIEPCPLHHISGDVARVNGQLTVSRAFGDKNLETHLRSDPDVINADIDAEADLLILTIDGLWKVGPSLRSSFSDCFIFTNSS